jgi:multicomponent Na+:H+ antiporter subunit F
MMQAAMLTLVITVAMSAGAGIVRVYRGPTPADRMLAALLSGTSGVAILLMVSPALVLPAATDIALVFVVLSVIAAMAFVKLWGSQ